MTTTPDRAAPAQVELLLTVNGQARTAIVPPRTTLADLLRERFHLTGTHLGCEHGVCGACTILLDGHSVRSCLILAVQADGCDVTTVEGLDEHPTTSRLRSCFSRNHALQCGFCTPGMLATATELIDEADGPLTECVVREAMTGNMCRCTGYQGIIHAVVEASSDDPGAPAESQSPSHHHSPQPPETQR